MKKILEQLEKINLMCCYATEEDTESAPAILIQIGVTVRNLITELSSMRECIECSWMGLETDCVMLGAIGPLCPECHETTERLL